MRSDNGGDYNSNDCVDFYRQARIKRELTVPYNPQQNGVSERKNIMICESTKAMMSILDIPSSLWTEASRTIVYIQNESPHVILENKTPEEVFTDEKPKVGHLRIFGCPGYIHVPKKKRRKKEPSQKKGTFVGYNEISNGYQIYVTGHNFIEVSRDVTFDEEVSFQRSR